MKHMVTLLIIIMLPFGALAGTISPYYTELENEVTAILSSYGLDTDDASRLWPQYKAAEDKKNSLLYHGAGQQAFEVQMMRQLMFLDWFTQQTTSKRHDFEGEAYQAVLTKYTDAGIVSIGGNYDDLPVIEGASDWDYFWGTTLHPQNTGWDEFWFQCQDPTKTVGDCVGTVAVGVVSVTLGPIIVAVVATSAIVLVAATIPVSGTVLGGFPTAALITSTLG